MYINEDFYQMSYNISLTEFAFFKMILRPLEYLNSMNRKTHVSFRLTVPTNQVPRSPQFVAPPQSKK